MVLPSTATLKFDVNSYGPTALALKALIASTAIPLDPQLAFLAGVTVASDTVAVNGGGQAERTVVCNLQAPPFSAVPVGLYLPPGVQTQIRVWSTSPNDNATAGAQSVTATYLDGAGNSHSETIVLKGKTKVLSVGVNFNRITAVAPNSATGVMNAGDIYFESVPIPNTKRIVYPMGVLMQGFFARNPVVGLWAKPFRNWLTSAIRMAVGSCIPVEPAFS
jgi:hypothetical protein